MDTMRFTGKKIWKSIRHCDWEWRHFTGVSPHTQVISLIAFNTSNGPLYPALAECLFEIKIYETHSIKKCTWYVRATYPYLTHKRIGFFFDHGQISRQIGIEHWGVVIDICH